MRKEKDRNGFLRFCDMVSKKAIERGLTEGKLEKMLGDAAKEEKNKRYREELAAWDETLEDGIEEE